MLETDKQVQTNGR